jgi:hypothetical protein
MKAFLEKKQIQNAIAQKNLKKSTIEKDSKDEYLNSKFDFKIVNTPITIWFENDKT